MRNYDKPLTFILTGSGTSKPENSRALLEDFIFGNLPGDAVVDVKFVVPYFGRIAPSLNSAIEILKEWGIDGDDFIPVVEPNAGHKSLVTATKTEQVDQGDSEQYAIDLLSQHRSDGRDVYYISIYDPERDLDTVTSAKDWTWLPTLNLAEGLIDSFDGYESVEDRAKREELQRQFDEEQKAKEAAEKPVKAPATKATAPRKRAAKKPVVQEDTPLVDAPEKPAVEPQKPKPAAGLIADAVAREAEKKAARKKPETLGAIQGTPENYAVEHKDMLTLSGTIAMSSKLPADLEPAKTVDPTPDVWKDVATAVPDATHISVAKEDLVKLNEGMQKMAEGFSDVLTAYNNMLEGK